MKSQPKIRAPRNRTLELSPKEASALEKRLVLGAHRKLSLPEILDRTILGDTFKVLDLLPEQFADLVVVDPPYNLSKKFNLSTFNRQSDADYELWLKEWIIKLLPKLKPKASLYLCCDWQTSPLVYNVVKNYLIPRNRITWEREKGRGAKANWKNCSEDIWFFTLGEDYTFNLDAVKMKRRVRAPYTDSSGKPKDWNKTEDGNFRLTHPSNFWSDITIPFWSMPENTDHPTQKAEKLLAKLILASSRVGETVFDPFLGSGSTSVVAKKLGRHFVGIEMDLYFASIAEKRLQLAESDKTVQGYQDGIFWERNSALKERET